MSDDLIRAFRSGDEAAVRELYGLYSGAVSTVARSIVVKPELVEEVVQKTFLKAWKSAESLDESREIAPWLYSIARRTAIDTLRHEQRPTTGGAEPQEDEPVLPVGFDRVYEAFEVRRAIDSLPDEERHVMELSHRLQFTHREIAEKLEVPVGTVKSRSARAHRRLASMLRHLSPETELRNSANQNEGLHVQDIKEVS